MTIDLAKPGSVVHLQATCEKFDLSLEYPLQLRCLSETATLLFVPHSKLVSLRSIMPHAWGTWHSMITSPSCASLALTAAA